jgi:hypothetical protein
VQLAGAQVSLTPLHSATASALFTSLLSLHNNTWGCLSEGILVFFGLLSSSVVLVFSLLFRLYTAPLFCSLSFTGLCSSCADT